MSGFDRRWYVYAFWAAFLPLVFVAAGLGAWVSEAVGSGLLIALSLSMMVAGVWGLVGYYYDARDAEETGYRPRWWAWAVAYVLLSPMVVAPIYLIRRTMKTGFPPRVASALGR